MKGSIIQTSLDKIKKMFYKHIEDPKEDLYNKYIYRTKNKNNNSFIIYNRGKLESFNKKYEMIDYLKDYYTRETKYNLEKLQDTILNDNKMLKTLLEMYYKKRSY